MQHIMLRFVLMQAMLVLDKSQPTTWDSVRKNLDRGRFCINNTLELSMNTRNLSSMLAKYDWNVMDILHSTYSAVVLNTPIVGTKFVISVWRKANFKVLIDGGGNILYDSLFNNGIENSTSDLPHILCGDFDSIRTDVLEFFRKCNVEIINTPDQNKTDFFKGLEILSKNTNVANVIVFCDNVGRLDHILQNLNILFKCSSHETLNRYNIFLLSNTSLTWLLRPGSHVIHVPQYLWTDESYCGLIPVGQACYHVTTKGLKWNLHDGELQFGKMVSSSNGYDTTSNEMEVSVSTDSKLIWTMNIDERISA